MEKIIGVLGGMGPEATVHMFNLIVQLTDARVDQDHVHVIIDSNPRIPPRPRYLLEGGESPLPALIESAQRLQKAGADFIVMPCHTAHHFHGDIVKHIDIPFPHLQLETVRHIETKYPDARRFGVLATEGTIKVGLFQALFDDPARVVVPDTDNQALLNESLFGPDGVKAGGKDIPRRQLMEVVRHLGEQKVDAVIVGCTEISMVLLGLESPLPLIDPLVIMARLVIDRARNRS